MLDRYPQLVLLGLALSVDATARPPRGGPSEGPPREAIEACLKAVAEAECSVEIAGRPAQHGICMPGPKADMPLACRPRDAGERGGERGGARGGDNEGTRGERSNRRPPPAAIDACAAVEVGAECGFTHRDRAVAGVCRMGPDEGAPAACVPEREENSKDRRSGR